MKMKVTFVISDASVFGELTLGAFSRVLLFNGKIIFFQSANTDEPNFVSF